MQRASDSKARGVIGNGHIFIVQCTMCAYVSRCDHVAKQRVGIKTRCTLHVLAEMPTLSDARDTATLAIDYDTSHRTP